MLKSWVFSSLCPKPNVSVQGFILGTKVGKIDFVHGIILVHHFRTGILDRFYGFSLKNPKNNCLFHNHESSKNRFPSLYSKNSMNSGLISVAEHYYQFTHESLPTAV